MKQRILQLLLLMFVIGFHTRADPQVIRAAYNALNGDFLPAWIADAKGMFKRNGLDVELIFIGGPQVVPALTAKEVGFAFMGGTTAVNAKLAGMNLVIVATAVNKPDFFIVARPDIRRPGDFKGGSIGVGRYGGSPDLLLRVALRAWKLEPDRDVKIIQLFGSHPERMAAVLHKRVDGAVIAPPTTLAAKKLGLRLFGFEQVLPEFLGNGLVTTYEMISKQERIVASFVKAFIEGIHYMKTNRDGSIQVLSRYTRLTDREILEETYDIYKNLIPSNPSTTVAAVQMALDIFEKKARPEDFFDNRFVEKVERSGGL